MTNAGQSKPRRTKLAAAVAADEHGAITAWSPEAEELTGHSAAAMMGLPAWEVCSRMVAPGRDANAVRRAVKTIVENVLASGHVPTGQPHHMFHFQRPDGEVRTIEHDFSAVPSGDGFSLVGVVREVDPQSALDETGAASYGVHRLLFEQMSSAVAIAEAMFDEAGQPTDYRVVDVNPAFETLTGLKADRLVGRLALELRPNIRPAIFKKVRHVAATGKPAQFETHGAVTDRYALIRLSRVGPALVVAMIDDVTEARRSEAAIRERNDFIETIVASAGDGIIVCDNELRYVLWNPVMEGLTGLSAGQVLGRNAWELFPEIMAAGVGEDLERALRGEAPTSREFEYVVPQTGRRGWVVQTNRPHRDAVGNIIGVVSSMQDITARHEMDEALRRSEEQFRTIFDGVGDGVAIYDPSGAFIEVNRMLCERLGYSREELLSMSISDIDSPESATLLPARVASIMEAGIALFEIDHLRRDGTLIPTEIVSRRIEFRGRPAILTVQRDVTERRQSEEALQKQTRLMQELLDAVPIPILAKDTDGRIVLANAAFVTAQGGPAEGILGKTYRELGQPEPDLSAEYDRLVLERETTQTYEADLRFSDGTVQHHVLTKAPLRSTKGEVVGVVTAGLNISDRYEAEKALRQSEERFRALFESAGDAIFISETSGRIMEANQTACERLGYGKGELLGLSLADISLPGEAAAIAERIAATREKGSLAFETSHVGRDGTVFPVEMIATMLDLGGQPAILGIARDASERKKAEKVREALEDQLRQAQKMEGIGQLAGGIAHDFNNLLTAIRGSASLALAELPPGAGAREDLEQIEQAADRAAGLTRQLLAFARRTVLQPEVVDLGEIVRRLGPMLRRIIGEDVSLATLVPKTACHVLADPGQLEQIIVNLAVNARDAMPDGGKVTIEVAPAEAGADAEADAEAGLHGPITTLSVTDTGVGMSPETLGHLFEPFFTTKGPGKGTGLGLATVYGIVRQSGGTVTARSELGRGSTFTVSLPRVEAARQVAAEVMQETAARGSRTGTILVVEDDNGVRRFASRVLEAAGYRVLVAPDGNAAVEASAHGTVQLLLTDVVMPGMSGRDVALKLSSAQPGIRVLYMSGHTDKGIVRDGVLEPDIEFLAKPFTAEALLAAVDKAISEVTAD